MVAAEKLYDRLAKAQRRINGMAWEPDHNKRRVIHVSFHDFGIELACPVPGGVVRKVVAVNDVMCDHFDWLDHALTQIRDHVVEKEAGFVSE